MEKTSFASSSSCREQRYPKIGGPSPSTARVAAGSVSPRWSSPRMSASRSIQAEGYPDARHPGSALHSNVACARGAFHCGISPTPPASGELLSQEFIPKWVAWETTQKCNLKCVHCRCSSDMQSSEGDFTTAEGKKLLEEIAAFSKPVVVLSGGEPLLRKDIFELAGHGTSLGLRMCMATNGALVTDEVCAKMKAADIKMVSLSLDGSTAGVHDDFRHSPGAFQGVVNAAALFRKHGQKFLVN